MRYLNEIDVLSRKSKPTDRCIDAPQSSTLFEPSPSDVAVTLVMPSGGSGPDFPVVCVGETAGTRLSFAPFAMRRVSKGDFITIVSTGLVLPSFVSISCPMSRSVNHTVKRSRLIGGLSGRKLHDKRRLPGRRGVEEEGRGGGGGAGARTSASVLRLVCSKSSPPPPALRMLFAVFFTG